MVRNTWATVELCGILFIKKPNDLYRLAFCFYNRFQAHQLFHRQNYHRRFQRPDYPMRFQRDTF